MKKSIKNILLLFILIVSMFSISVISYAKEDTKAVPVYGTDIKDGTYEVEMESSSSMFRIVKAELTVENGSMTVVMTLSGTGYLKLYMGTGEEALNAGEESYIPYVEDAEGAYTYTIPVEALDVEFECTAYSKKKETWYDRQLVVLSSSLPEEAFLNERGTDVEDPALVPVQMREADGDYQMEVTLNGGSGKATVSSPANVHISGGTATVSIEWSSPNFDYMIVNGKQYFPVNTEGNSVFELPVLALDKEFPVIADTVAMSKPHEVSYTLFFHADTLQKEQGGNMAMVIIIAAAAVVLMAAVVVVLGVRKRNKRVG